MDERTDRRAARIIDEQKMGVMAEAHYTQKETLFQASLLCFVDFCTFPKIRIQNMILS